jgi:hypothetical protein
MLQRANPVGHATLRRVPNYDSQVAKFGLAAVTPAILHCQPRTLMHTAWILCF